VIYGVIIDAKSQEELRVVLTYLFTDKIKGSFKNGLGAWRQTEKTGRRKPKALLKIQKAKAEKKFESVMMNKQCMRLQSIR